VNQRASEAIAGAVGTAARVFDRLGGEALGFVFGFDFAAAIAFRHDHDSRWPWVVGTMTCLAGIGVASHDEIDVDVGLNNGPFSARRAGQQTSASGPRQDLRILCGEVHSVELIEDCPRQRVIDTRMKRFAYDNDRSFAIRIDHYDVARVRRRSSSDM